MPDSSNPEQGQRIPPNVFRVDCGSRRVLDLIADTWSILVLYALESEPLRYSDMERKVEGISQKMLTQTLHQLRRNGLVTQVALETGSGSQYTLSPLGQTLLVPLGELCQWAQDNMAEVELAQQDYGRGDQ